MFDLRVLVLACLTYKYSKAHPCVHLKVVVALSIAASPFSISIALVFSIFLSVFSCFIFRCLVTPQTQRGEPT